MKEDTKESNEDIGALVNKPSSFSEKAKNFAVGTLKVTVGVGLLYLLKEYYTC